MKKTFLLAFAAVALLCSCGAPSASQNQQSNGSAAGSILGAVASGVLQGASQAAANKASEAASKAKTAAGNTLSAINSNSLISGIIGMLTNGAVSETSLEGTWVYTEPTVQFESENLLAKAGGAIAANSIVQKLAPYYEKVGIKNGSMSATFNGDKTCNVTFGSYNINGTYAYDAATHTITVTNQFGMKLITAFATLSNNQLALTFDSSKLLTLATTMGAASGNSNLNTISQLAGSFSGMKSGFLFNRK